MTAIDPFVFVKPRESHSCSRGLGGRTRTRILKSKVRCPTNYVQASMQQEGCAAQKWAPNWHHGRCPGAARIVSN